MNLTLVRRCMLGLMLLVAAGFFVGCASLTPKVERWGMVTGVRPEKIAYYKDLHAHPWPAVGRKITECNIHNYSIYLRELEPGKFYLFSYFEYTGKDFKADMAKMAADPETNRWWKETDPCQQPIALRNPDEKIWSRMEEVFYQK